MHMADALLNPVVGTTMAVASATCAVYSAKKVKEELDPKKVPVMGVMGAFVFAAQMINFTIPGTGSSGHLCGGVLLAALLGPYAAFLTMIAILLIQCLLFADGGILALGCNVWNMAFYACFFGYFCLYRPIVARGMNRRNIVIASVLASVVSLQLGAFSVVLQTSLSGITELPLRTFSFAMQPIHLLIGLVEGFVSAAVLIFIFQMRPELLSHRMEAAFSMKKALILISVVALLTGGGFSLLASGYPDGLEWSIEKVSGASEIENEGALHKQLASVQEKTAVLPDYSFGDDNPIGTSFSGILGSVIVAALCMVVAVSLGVMRKKKVKA